jgi:outer membrane receptor protein involved in Fe transport
MNISKVKYLFMPSLVGLAISSTFAAEQTEDEKLASKEIAEIIVVVARREQSMQEVPVAVSALSGAALEDLGAEGLGDYFAFIPSVNAAHNTYGQRGGQNIIIRGVANGRLAGTDASSMSATTGFYLNDVPVTPVDTQLFDIGHIEVIRGPQGTLYGAASMGGSIKVYHNRPDSTEFEAVIQGTREVVNDGGDGGGYNAMINLPIIDGVLAARIVASSRNTGGFIDTIIPSLNTTEPNTTYPIVPALDLGQSNTKIFQQDTNSSQSEGLRAAVSYIPGERLSINASVLWQSASVDDMSAYNSALPKERLRETYMLEPKASEMTLNTLNVSYDFDSISVHSDTSYYTRKFNEIIDFTPVMYSIGGASDAGLDYIPALGILEGEIKWKTLTQEIRIQSNDYGGEDWFDGRLNWIAGAFLMDEERLGSQLLHAPGWGAAAPDVPLPVANDVYLANTWVAEDKNAAVFADFSFDITDRLTASAGVRYFDQSTNQSRPKIDSVNPVIPGPNITRQAETGTIPRFNIAYEVSDDMNLYGSVSEGFRLGGATQPIDYDASPECESVVEDNNLQQFAAGEYDSDRVKTYDIGMKTAFAKRRATLNVSAYHTDWSNLQQQVSLGGFEGSQCTRVLTANVGSATIDGVELELTALLTDSLNVKASLSYTDAQIESPGEGVSVTKVGDRIQNVPDWSGSLIARYDSEMNIMGGGNVFVQGDVRYMGERSSVIGEPSNPLLILDPYTLIGFRTGVTLLDDSLTVTLYVKNLFDETIQLNAIGRFGVSSNILVNTAAPRTVGVTIQKSF